VAGEGPGRLLDGTQVYVLVVIQHSTWRIRILGVTLHPTGQWTAQQACNLLMDLGEQADRIKFMIRWIGGCRRELLDRTLIWHQAHLRRILRQYENHHCRVCARVSGGFRSVRMWPA
jgi:putative transposase